MSKIFMIYSNRFKEFGFMPEHLIKNWTKRFFLLEKKLVEENVVNQFEIIAPRQFNEDTLLVAHSKKYIEYVKSKSKAGKGYLDYGDTIAYEGVFEDALLVVSSTLTAAEISKEGKITFNPNGGYHHARSDGASGFCVFNDVAVAARYLKKWFRKIAIVDIDLHHGDGTQWILYHEPILKISMHAYGIYPGTGDINEIGKGDGKGYNLNAPLLPLSGDDAGIYVIDNLIIPALEAYAPEILLVQMGTDGHKDDWMGGLKFSYNFYNYFSLAMKRIISNFTEYRYVGMGGGGYTPESTVNSWILMLSNLLGVKYNIVLGNKTEGGLEHIKAKIERLKELVDWF